MDDNQIKVLIVDDSLFMRRVLSQLISPYGVVTEASNGLDALKKIPEVLPDVVLLDIEMPIMDGLDTLREIMARHPMPVVCISGSTRYGAGLTLNCLELGAIDFIVKPSSRATDGLAAIGELIKRKLLTAARARVRPARVATHRLGSQTKQLSEATPAKPTKLANRVVVIAASTGGPTALQEVLIKLQTNLRAAVLVVQHMPPVFTGAMANRLDGLCNISVAEAKAGDVLVEGHALVAPGGMHLRLDAQSRIVLSDDAPLWGVRPAADYTFIDVAERFGAKSLGIVLTGMGSDASKGLLQMKRAGACTIAQDEETSLIFGMPRAAIEIGAASKILPLPSIGDEIMRWNAEGCDAS